MTKPKGRSKLKARLLFIRKGHGCTECDTREGCFKSSRREAGKHISFSVPEGEAGPIRKRLVKLRYPTSDIVDVPGKLGLLQPPGFRLLAAEARKLHRALFLHASIQVTVDYEVVPCKPVLVAENTAPRQRRRQTWAEKVDGNALRAGDHVQVHVAGSEELLEFIRG